MKKILKNFSKTLIILFIFSVILSSVLFESFGFNTSGYDVYGGNGSISPKIDKLLSQALGVVQVVAGFAGVISLMWLGISFMKGAPEGKAEAKKKVYLILIGAILIFGASTLVKWIADEAGNL